MKLREVEELDRKRKEVEKKIRERERKRGRSLVRSYQNGRNL